MPRSRVLGVRLCVCRVSLMTREVKGEKNTCLHSSLINYLLGDALHKDNLLPWLFLCANRKD